MNPSAPRDTVPSLGLSPFSPKITGEAARLPKDDEDRIANRSSDLSPVRENEDPCGVRLDLELPEQPSRHDRIGHARVDEKSYACQLLPAARIGDDCSHLHVPIVSPRRTVYSDPPSH